jgi:hypothetical protein
MVIGWAPWWIAQTEWTSLVTQGVRFVACPASRGGRKVQCISCGGRFGLPLCAQADRGFVITFPAHGARAAAAAAHCS